MLGGDDYKRLNAMQQAKLQPSELVQKTDRAAMVRRNGAGAAVAAILVGIFAVEGGYVNDPLDSGGATNNGVTEKVARAAGYRGDMRAFPKHCDGGAAVCAASIYTRDYIQPFMPMLNVEPAIGAELSDTAVNMGVGRSSYFLKVTLNRLGDFGLPVRGAGASDADVAAYRALAERMGPVKACVAVLDGLDAMQRAKYLAIVAAKPSQKRFLKGWLNHRIGNVKRSACETGVL